MKVYVFFFLFWFLTDVFADSLYEDSVYREAILFVNDCGSRSLTLCFKEKALKFIERLPNNIDIGNGIRIKQSDSGRLAREYTPISLPNETVEREAILDRMLLERITDYLSSHTLEFKFPISSDLDMSAGEARKKEGGGGGEGGFGGGGGGGKKGGKKGGMGMMMMMFYMKAAAMYAIGLKVVAMIAFKALLAAKIALTIAGIIALKKLVESKHHTQTYEVVAHPVSHGDDYSHYDRAFNQELVYKGHRIGS